MPARLVRHRYSSDWYRVPSAATPQRRVSRRPINRIVSLVVPRTRMEAERTISPERADQLAAQRALIERARWGDASAHRALYESHVDRVYRLAFRLTGRHEVAREMTQDTFVRAFAGIEGFLGHSSFSTWVD